MSDGVKITLILAGAAVLVACLYLYFSPYQSCVRAGDEEIANAENAATYNDPRIWCARISN